MQRKECFADLDVLRGKVLRYGRWAVALTIVIATLTLVSGTSGFQLDGESHPATAGDTPALRLVRGATGSQSGREPDSASTYNILHLFKWAKAPSGNLVFDAGGDLYGTSSGGGVDNPGTIFELTHGTGGWTETVLYSFTGGNDGAYPWTPLVLDPTGTFFFGTTLWGGTAGDTVGGVVYKYVP